MTTPPKARKYRVRARQDTAGAEQPDPEGKPAKKSDPVEAIKQIEAEDLTPKQLRLARRNAQRHGLEPASDYDAVRLLREHDLDPFAAPRSLRVVRDAKYQEGTGLPAKTTDRPASGPQLLTTDAQAESIRAIQRDIVRRRRRNFALLVMRLCFFILLPTMLAGYYFYAVATPMYATKTEFVIQQSEAAGSRAGGGLFSGTGMATQLDSLNVQGYLQSREAMLRLNKDLGFKAHYQQEHIDPIRRLPADASDEKAYKFYKRNVRISYDTTEGIVKMEIVAADPETSKAFALALIGYAEERIDRLTERMREDQMRSAREHFTDVEAQLLEAQQEYLTLQKQKSIFDANAETSRVMGQVTTFETELTDKRLRLQQVLNNPDPSPARVNGLRSDIARLEAVIEDLRSSLIDDVDGAESLASVLAELTISEMNMHTRQAMVTSAMEEMENARVEANRQTRFLSMSVNPILPDEPAYPRAFENTFLTMLVFSGIYLMISITAAVLREQLAG